MEQIKRAVAKKNYKENKESGMNFIRMMQQSIRTEREIEEKVPESKIVGVFGIAEPSGFVNRIHWSLCGYRSEDKHGALDPAPPCEYSKSMFDSMFKGWGN